VFQDTELSEAEKAARQKKAEAIRRMLLSETQITAELCASETSGAAGTTTNSVSSSANDRRSEKATMMMNSAGGDNCGGEDPPALIKAKVEAEKRRREHMLALNQALAKEVIERTKIVAGTHLFATHSTPILSLFLPLSFTFQ
jgi:hypothetical protein